MTQRVIFFFRISFVSAIFVLLFLVVPSHASAACPNKTQITNPPDGQNYVAEFPYRVWPRFTIGNGTAFYDLDLYKGTPGNAELVYGDVEGNPGCVTDFSNGHHPYDFFTENGDYFYVLYTAEQRMYDLKGLMDMTSWENHWEHGGTVYDIYGNPFMPSDYTISRFSIGSTRIPVVLVPGIGSTFNLDVMLKDQQSSATAGNWNFLPGMPYDNLVQSFEGAGYQEGKDLFVAYYDWRQSNNINDAQNSVDDYLIPTIDKAKALCQCSKVAIVAHSMGGLVARSYVQSDEYESRNDVSHLFLIGTPNDGSSNVYTLWEGGHIPINWDVVMQGAMHAYLWFESDNKIAAAPLDDSGDPERFAVVHDKVPSVQQILPTYNYLDLGSILQPFINMFQQNPFLPTLNQNTDILSSRTKLYTFVGENQPTVNNIPADPWTQALGGLWEDGLANPEDPVPNDTNGDNQVLLSSSELSQALRQYTYSADHGKIVVDSAPDIIKILADATVPAPSYSEPTGSLMYSITSSADISITDPSGNTISKTANTIGDGAKYFSTSDGTGGKIVIINNPSSGNYQIDVHGDSSGGSFQMLAGSVTQNGNDSSAVQEGNITSGQTITYNSSYEPATADADSSISLDEAGDTTPPTIAINAPLQQKYNRGDIITIDVSATDDSGISSTTITLDGTIQQEGDMIHLSSLSLGDHTLEVDATDSAGNEAQQTIAFTNTVNADDVTQDIESVASCGCISKRSVKEYLLNDTSNIAGAADLNAKQAAIQDFSQYISSKRDKAISERAYQLLLQDIKWLH